MNDYRVWGEGEERPEAPCEHARAVDRDRDENDDRIRVRYECEACGKRWHACFAKRLDDEGREAWGPVGVWVRSEVERAREAGRP